MPDKLLSNDKCVKMVFGNLYYKWNLWISTLGKRQNWTPTVLNRNSARNIAVETWCFGKDNVIKAFYPPPPQKKKDYKIEKAISWVVQQLAFIFVFDLNTEKYLWGVWEFKWSKFLATLYLHRGYFHIYARNLRRMPYILNFLRKIVSSVLLLYTSSFIHSFNTYLSPMFDWEILHKWVSTNWNNYIESDYMGPKNGLDLYSQL